MKTIKSFFANKRLVIHLLRGAAGIGALWYAFAVMDTCYLCSIVAIGLALLAFRGCPACWISDFGGASCKIPKKPGPKPE